jgi:hypothetical protein
MSNGLTAKPWGLPIERQTTMNDQTTTWVYSAEQKALWDKCVGKSGYHQVVGEQAYTFLVHTIARLVDNPDDPKTVLLVGTSQKCSEFLEQMVEREVIESVWQHQPKFFRFDDRDHDGEDIEKSLLSEMDAEQFRNFIATSLEKEYYPIAAVVIFDQGYTNGEPYPFLGKILDVPVWKNGHLAKTIRPAVFNISEGDCGDDSLNFKKESSDVASVDWRKDTKTYFELKTEKPVMLIEHLIPEKALTIMAAPSYTGKTHIAIEMGLSLATGTAFLDHFKGPAQPVPVSYHVPELHESLFHDFSERLGASERLKDCPDNFLIRTLEHDLWLLDSPQMVDSSRGRYVFLDTVGYFNDADDSASYTQAITFAKKINNLIREGCFGVCALYHPPKYSKNKKDTGNVMTLENQILGSAGYGGVLRSCLGMRNLHEDSNKGLWVYVQGLKNPHLAGPFQIEGVPLRLVKKPGESLYLAELLKDGGGKREQAIAMLNEGKKRDEVCKQLHISPNTLSKWKNDTEFDSNKGDEDNDNAE